jgi:uncharacterized membrane protein
MFDYLLLVSAILLVVIDSIYLQMIKDFFIKQIQSVQGEPIVIHLLGLVLCYIFLICGINYFIIIPNRPVIDAFLLGLVIYGVYESTNYSLFKKWSILTVLIDTLWGGILFAVTTYLTYKFKNLLRI